MHGMQSCLSRFPDHPSRSKLRGIHLKINVLRSPFFPAVAGVFLARGAGMRVSPEVHFIQFAEDKRLLLILQEPDAPINEN